MFKLGVTVRNTRILMMIASLGMSGWAHGAEIQWAPTQDRAGLTVMLPKIAIDELISDVAILKVTLKHDEKRLSRRIEQGRMTNSESLLSLLLPGGMFYAAYKKSSHARALSEHEHVLAQINVITEDINVITSSVGPILIAKR